MDVFYKGVKIGNRRVDFFVEEKVMVEIKNDQENPQYEVQMRKFLKEYL